MRLTALRRCIFVVATTFATGSGSAQEQLPQPDATDPVKLEIMAGSPPPANKRVVLGNVLQYPNARWAFHHMREMAPTRALRRKMGSVAELPVAAKPLDNLEFDDGKGGRLTIAEWQERTYTDALLVLHRGSIVLENYHVGMRANQPHALWSMSKSFVGFLAGMLIEEGVLDPQATLSSYVPELAGSAWGEATIAEAQDMTVKAAYDENFRDRKSAIFQYLFATGLIAPPPDYPGARAIYDYLPTVQAAGEHGSAFSYKSVDTEALAWVLRRATGKGYAALLSEKLWSRIGAEFDAYYLLDPIGTEIASIGLNATARDLARFAEMLRLEGSHGGEEVAAAAVETIMTGADREKFKAAGQAPRDGYSYNDQWWIPHDGNGGMEAKGLFGQHMHINPAAELVIVKLSSHPIGETLFTHQLDRAAFAVIAKAVSK